MFFKPFKIIDSHIHFPHHSYGDRLMAILAEVGIEKLAVVCTPDEKRLSLVPDALHLKGKFPDQVYLFGGLDISPCSSRRTSPVRSLPIMWMCCLSWARTGSR